MSNFVIKETIGKVYIKKKKNYRIPRFQRQYTWEDEQIKEFFE